MPLLSLLYLENTYLAFLIKNKEECLEEIAELFELTHNYMNGMVIMMQE